jgi:DNA repair photolyase
MGKKESVKVAVLTVIMEIMSKEGVLTPLETKKARVKRLIDMILVRIQTLTVANMSINTKQLLKEVVEPNWNVLRSRKTIKIQNVL